MSTALLAWFLVVVGIGHGVVPGYFERLVPPWVPAPRTVVLVSGAAEIALGVGLLLPPTRTVAAVATVALFVAYVGTHVDALVRSRRGHVERAWLDRTPAATVRVIVNVLYVGWAAAVAVSVA